MKKSCCRENIKEIQKDCHSRVFLSGIPTALAKQGGDPRLQASGMTCNFKEKALNKNAFRAPLRSGFTLIELLVVVLIIGILAAIALPQYQKAVDMANFRQLDVIGRQLARALEWHYVQNGTYPTDWRKLEFDVPGCTTKQYSVECNGLKFGGKTVEVKIFKQYTQSWFYVTAFYFNAYYYFTHSTNAHAGEWRCYGNAQGGSRGYNLCKRVCSAAYCYYK